MANGGKVEEQGRARELRADAWTLKDIADELGVSKSSVSLWVRDVDFEPRGAKRASEAPTSSSGRRPPRSNAAVWKGSREWRT